MFETILIAIIIAKLKRYDIKLLFKNWTIYPIIIFEFIYFIGQTMIFKGNYEVVGLLQSLKSIYLMMYLILIFKYEIYLEAIIGAGCVILGGILNDIAIRSNGGFMPVFPSLSYITGYAKPEGFGVVNDFHILGNSQTNLKILTDYIDLGYSILSIGDILIRIFVFLIIYKSIVKSNKLTKEDDVKC